MNGGFENSAKDEFSTRKKLSVKLDLITMVYVLHGWEAGIRIRLVLEIDSLMAQRLMMGKNCDAMAAANLVQTCRDMLARFWTVKVVYVYREANHVADWCASHGTAPRKLWNCSKKIELGS